MLSMTSWQPAYKRADLFLPYARQAPRPTAPGFFRLGPLETTEIRAGLPVRAL